MRVKDVVVDRSQTGRGEVLLAILQAVRTIPLHQHPDMEWVYFIVQGTGLRRMGAGARPCPERTIDLRKEVDLQWARGR